MKQLIPSLVVLLLSVAPTSAKTVCTIVADARTGDILLEQGDCRSRVTPASTVKIALSLMGFDSGFLASDSAPVLPFKQGYADVSGDAGRNNALERAWIGSSLKIAPVEQIAFLRNLLSGNLPVAPGAIEQTLAIVEITPAGDGWMVSGKTGSAYMRRADGSFDRAKAWGWFVGWASNADRSLVFARLNQDEKRETGSAGIRTKQAFLKQWPKLAEAAR